MNRSLGCLAACLLASVSLPASAALFDFSYTTRSDDPYGRPAVTASGKIDADLFGSTYSINDLTGTRDGVAITSYDFNDLFAQSFTLFGNGAVASADFAYHVGDATYNVFGGPNVFTEDPLDAGGVQIPPAARTLAQFSITPSAVTPVPEPASWALMIGGLGLIGASARRRATKSRNEANAFSPIT